MLEWAIPTLQSLRSTRLESVDFGGCMILDQDTTSAALRTLDQVLTEGPGRNTLKRVEVMDWRIVVMGVDGGYQNDLSDEATRDYLRDAFSNCHARGILYDEFEGDPL